MFRAEEIFQIGCRLSSIDPSKQPVVGKTTRDESIVNSLYWVRDALNRNEINRDIASSISDYASRINSKYSMKPSSILDYSDQQETSMKIKLWLVLVEKELKQRRILEPAKMGILNQEQLYETSSRMANEFFNNVWWGMSEIEREDFAEAARCLLAQSWTAAAMISLRGLESILRKYYTFKTKNEVGRKGMYTLIDELQQIEDISKTLLGYLNYLRGIRNMAEHPDRIFHQIGAETVFTQVAGAAREIYAEMKAASA